MSEVIHKSRGNKNDLSYIQERRIAIRLILAGLGGITDKQFIMQELAKQRFHPSKRTLDRDLAEVNKINKIKNRLARNYKKKIDLCYHYVKQIIRECDTIIAESKKDMTVTSVTIGPRVKKITEEINGKKIAGIRLYAIEHSARAIGLLVKMLNRASKGSAIDKYLVMLMREYAQVKVKRMKTQSLVKKIMTRRVTHERLFKKAVEKKPRERKKKKIIRINIP